MNYTAALDYIHSRNKFGIKLGLENISSLLKSMGSVQNKLKFIHIAGTNGKGSTSSMLSHALCACGYKTGLFISPYVVCFNERIQINNEYFRRHDKCLFSQIPLPVSNYSDREQFH